MIWADTVIVIIYLAVAAFLTNLLLSSDTTVTPVKNEWPELEGATINDAKNAILKDRPDLDESFVVFVIQGSTVTSDYNEKRVRIFYDPETNVVVGITKFG